MIKLKPKPKLKTRSQLKSIDDKYYGSEPLGVDGSDDRAVTNAFNWYNYMYDATQAKKWVIEYLKKEKRSAKLISEIRSAPDWRTPTTAGWMARMMMNGTTFDSIQMERFEERLRLNALYGVKEVKVEAAPKNVVSIQDRVKKNIYNLITEVEEAIDNDANLNIYEWLMGKQTTPQAASAIYNFYYKFVGDHEADELDTRADKKRRAELKKYWQNFVSDVERYINNKKAVKIRKPREKKVKSAVDQVSKMKYQKEFPQLKIVSVNPAEIVGCKQLWTYNTKYKKLTRYDASGPNGIQVKGTTLIGYDAETSSTKSLRKPDTVIPSLLGAGKVALRTFLEEIKTNETKPNGRINPDTILLRVVK